MKLEKFLWLYHKVTFFYTNLYNFESLNPPLKILLFNINGLEIDHSLTDFIHFFHHGRTRRSQDYEENYTRFKA